MQNLIDYKKTRFVSHKGYRLNSNEPIFEVLGFFHEDPNVANLMRFDHQGEVCMDFICILAIKLNPKAEDKAQSFILSVLGSILNLTKVYDKNDTSKEFNSYLENIFGPYIYIDCSVPGLAK
jgi:hypothetical protein